jgi:peroxiredoxin
MVGRVIPDCRLLTPEGREVRLRDALGRPLVLIFLRHLA